MNANLQAILDDDGAATLADLARTLYKYTDAGISLAARLDDGTCLWNGSAGQRDASLLPRVAALGVSSIVEGTDAEVPLHWVDLAAADAVALFGKACDDVNAWACQIWDDTHGCDTCAAHWAAEGDAAGAGAVRVWKECPDCEGAGVVI